ncbi:nitroreductase family protein [Halodesulfovibrio marinisediminis]|uniref:Nitroreductase n=1 Tax=Halodesulfovibrio marinisediminis DSM 17456 TaxID=1121457 RepID=A0A1N6DCP9_9BACT|nr:nitroreductase family protein [Halodesulfovibrio marinisediminis]SIN68581.1 Nitroreductase [Halodesulfovibrio marinisediminis DSM 17456]
MEKTFKQILQNRRAINFFDPERKVPEGLLRELVADAAHTPSSFNLQPWNIIVLRDKDEKMRLQKLAMNQPKVSEAPVTLIMLADTKAWHKDNDSLQLVLNHKLQDGELKEEQRDWFHGVCEKLYGKSRDSELAFAVKNTAFFAMSLMYAATARGLQTHPMDGFDHDGVKKEFNIPENYWVPLLMSVGYHAKNAEVLPIKQRKSYDDIVLSFA